MLRPKVVFPFLAGEVRRKLEKPITAVLSENVCNDTVISQKLNKPNLTRDSVTIIISLFDVMTLTAMLAAQNQATNVKPFCTSSVSAWGLDVY